MSKGCGDYRESLTNPHAYLREASRLEIDAIFFDGLRLDTARYRLALAVPDAGTAGSEKLPGRMEHGLRQ